MALSYSDISSFLSESKKKKPSTTGDFESPKVDDSSVKITEGSFTIGPGHRGAMKGTKIYNKGKSTTNPNEKDAFLKKSGAQLPPLAQKKPSTQMAGYQPEGDMIGEVVGGKPGDGYIGHPNLDIKNPLAKKQVKGPTGNRGLAGKLGDRKMRIDKMTNQMLNQSVEPEGKLIEETDMRFCPKCEKMEAREECAYGPDYWDTFAIKNISKKVEEGAAWTRKEGQNPEGGLNEKGRKSAKADGHNLKRPSKVKGNKRRASFCARMKGMKKKLTSAETARDPDSRINKSLRAWDCN